MPYYSLFVGAKKSHLNTNAKDRQHALQIFGQELNCTLSVDEDSAPTEYLLDEWNENPHWLNHTIPVSAKPKSAS